MRYARLVNGGRSTISNAATLQHLSASVFSFDLYQVAFVVHPPGVADEHEQGLDGLGRQGDQVVPAEQGCRPE